MKMRSLKNMGICLTLAALMSTQAIYAHHSGSHSSSSSSNIVVPPCDSILLAQTSLRQILGDLNVALLAEALPTTNTTAIVTAYNLDITTAAANLQNALITLGGSSTSTIAFGFDSYAIAAEQFAAGTGTQANFNSVALNTLAPALASLSPSIKIARINTYVQSLVNAQTGIIQQDTALNFSAAIVNNHQAYVVANELLNYIFKKISKDNNLVTGNCNSF